MLPNSEGCQQLVICNYTDFTGKTVMMKHLISVGYANYLPLNVPYLVSSLDKLFLPNLWSAVLNCLVLHHRGYSYFLFPVVIMFLGQHLMHLFLTSAPHIYCTTSQMFLSRQETLPCCAAHHVSCSMSSPLSLM